MQVQLYLHVCYIHWGPLILYIAVYKNTCISLCTHNIFGYLIRHISPYAFKYTRLWREMTELSLD